MIYSDMSDFEIDAAVAAIKYPGRKITNFAGEAVVWFENLHTKVVRYCNSWADAGPIIQEAKINLVWGYDEKWGARTVHTTVIQHENPLRAVCIVFLMMKGADNG